jgi:hypothetical protein
MPHETREPPGNQTTNREAQPRRSRAMWGPVWQGMTIIIVSSNQKVPDLWTPRLFRSGLKGLSHSLHVNNTQPLRTRTFSTKGRPTALGACVPSDKDGLNSAPSHMKWLGIATSAQETWDPAWQSRHAGLPRVGTPLWKGLEDKTGRTSPIQGLYAPDWNPSAADSAEEGTPNLHRPPQKLSSEAKPTPQDTDPWNLLEHRPSHCQEYYRTCPNIVEAFNQSRWIDHVKSGPTGHVNLIVDIKIINLYLSSCPSAIKGPIPFRQRKIKIFPPFHLTNFSSSQVTPIVTLFILFNNKNAGRRTITS